MMIWFFAMALVFFTGTYPESWWHFLRGIVGWDARLVAYLASLVDRHPPFTLATSPVSPAAVSSL